MNYKKVLITLPCILVSALAVILHAIHLKIADSDHIFQIRDTVEIMGFSYEVSACEVTKKNIIVHLTVKNMQQAPRVSYLDGLITLETEGQKEEIPGECRFDSQTASGAAAGDCSQISYEAYEEKEVTVVFPKKNEEIREEHLFLHINPLDGYEATISMP